MDLQFFSVSLPNNILTLKQAVPVINHFYDTPKISIICPDASINTFSQDLDRYKNITFIPESSLISLDIFRSLMEKYALELGVDAHEIHHFNWYYQQALKIVFALQNATESQSVVMLDADTILLNKIKFFSNGESKLYGSLSEFHQPYFQTMADLLNPLPEEFLAFTIQFFSCTGSEAKFLRNALQTYMPKEQALTDPEWISSIIIKSVMTRHHVFKPAFFSEQELFGLSNKIFSQNQQEKITHLRYGFKGPLDALQMTFLRLLGFKHLTYEPVEQFSSEHQSWRLLIKLAAREFYRQRTGRYLKKAMKNKVNFC